MLKEISEYFNFNKGERNGIFVVIAIIIIVLALPYLIKVTTSDNSEEFVRFSKEVSVIYCLD